MINYRLNLQKNENQTAVVTINFKNSGLRKVALEKDSYVDFQVKEGEEVTLKLQYGDRALNVSRGNEWSFLAGQTNVPGLEILVDNLPEPTPEPTPEPEVEPEPTPEPEVEPEPTPEPEVEPDPEL